MAPTPLPGTPARVSRCSCGKASLLQTGWFVESLLTQTLIIHVIGTNRILFFQSRASWPLVVMTAVIMLIGVLIPFSPPRIRRRSCPRESFPTRPFTLHPVG
jgi:magnesium-transporting ATPase (P-type)